LALRGCESRKTVTFAPHLPADWNSLGMTMWRIGENKLQLDLTRPRKEFFLEAGRTAGTGESTTRISSGHQLARNGAKGRIEWQTAFRSEWKPMTKISM